MNPIQLAPHTFAIDYGTNMYGAVLDGDAFILIDTGLEAAQAKKADKTLNKPIRAIYHTHSHADHMGGSAYFAQKYNAPVYMPAEELSFAHMPLLEGALLYGGASPASLRNKFFLAEAVNALPLLEEDQLVTVPLKGHSPGHTGYLSEGVFFLGDSVLSPAIVQKHGVLYFFDPEAAYASLDIIEQTAFDQAVLCHKDAVSRKICLEYIHNQRAHMDDIAARVLRLADGRTADEITLAIMAELAMRMAAGTMLLAGNSIKGYLSMLARNGQISEDFSQEKGIVYRV